MRPLPLLPLRPPSRICARFSPPEPRSGNCQRSHLPVSRSRHRCRQSMIPQQTGMNAFRSPARPCPRDPPRRATAAPQRLRAGPPIHSARPLSVPPLSHSTLIPPSQGRRRCHSPPLFFVKTRPIISRATSENVLRMCVPRLFPRLVGGRRALSPARGLSKVWLLVDVPNQHMHVSEHQPRMLV